MKTQQLIGYTAVAVALLSVIGGVFVTAGNPHFNKCTALNGFKCTAPIYNMSFNNSFGDPSINLKITTPNSNTTWTNVRYMWAPLNATITYASINNETDPHNFNTFYATCGQGAFFSPLNPNEQSNVTLYSVSWECPTGKQIGFPPQQVNGTIWVIHNTPTQNNIIAKVATFRATT